MSEAAAAPLTILLVEDEEATRLFVRVLLERMGHTVREADSTAAALKHAQKQAFDLVLLDLGLPDGDGHELAAALLESAPGGIRIIAMSSRVEPGDEVTLRAHGVAALVAKPLTPAKLKELLQPGAAAVIDQPALEEHRAVLGGDRLGHVIDQFLHTAADAAIALRDFTDLGELAKVIHKMGGGAATLALHRLADAALQLEKHAKAGNSGAVAAGRAEVAALLGQAVGELKRYRGSL